jgi:hypothetical protein
MELPKQKIEIKGFESYGLRFELTAVDGGDTVHMLIQFPDKNEIEIGTVIGQTISLVVKK